MLTKLTCVFLTAFALFGVSQAHAGDSVDATTDASYDLKLEFTVAGQIIKIPVKAGDHVKAGDPLILLDDQEGAALVKQYTLKATSNVVVDEAQKQYELAVVERDQQHELEKHQATSPIEVKRADIKADLAKLDIDKATDDKKEAQAILDQAAARHAKYSLCAPIDGVVDKIIVSEGESVESLKPVLRLVNIDPLYVDAAVPTEQTLKLKAGDSAWVTHKLPSYTTPVKGKILYFAQVADSASDTRIVRIEVPNPNHLPAGDAVSVSFADPGQDKPGPEARK